MNELELLQQLDAKREEYKAKYEAYPTKKMADGSEAKDIPANDVEGLKALMAEINEIGAKYDDARKAREIHEGILEAEEAKNKPVNRLGQVGGVKNETKSMVDMLFDSQEFKSRSRARFADTQVLTKDSDFLEVKNLFQTTAGFAPFVSRDGKVVPAITRPPQLIDFIRVEPHSENAIKHMKQTVAAAQASGKGEGQALNEATITYTEVTTPIVKIGVYIPITEEQMEDEDGVRSLVENDLRRDTRVEADRQVTVGSGSGNNMTGLYNATSALSQARGTDEEFDQIEKAITKARVSGRVRPNLIVLHSNNMSYLTRKRTSDGIFILQHPGETPLQRLWGVPVVYSEALTVNTGMVLDTDYFALKLRKDLTLGVSDSHGEYFIQNTLALRLHMRAGLQIARDEAVVKLTGLRNDA